MRKLLAGISLGLAVLVSGVIQADDQGANAIVNKAIKALGSDTKVSKFKAATYKGKGKFSIGGNDIAFTGDWAIGGLTKFKMAGEGEFNGQQIKFVRILNGDKASMLLNDDSRDLEDDQLERIKQEAFVQWITLGVGLSDKGLKLKPKGESKVGDKAVVGLTVSKEGRKDIDLFFDKATGLLVKSESQGKDLQGADAKVEILYSNYKAVDGIQRPHKIVTNNDGNFASEVEITEFKPLEKVEDKAFEK